MEELVAGTNRNPGEAEARCSCGSVEIVALDGSAERVEEPIEEVALELEGVLVVGALDLLELEEAGLL